MGKAWTASRPRHVVQQSRLSSYVQSDWRSETYSSLVEKRTTFHGPIWKWAGNYDVLWSSFLSPLLLAAATDDHHSNGLSQRLFNPLECWGNYSATSNDMKLVHWPLMGGLLHLVQRGGDWAGPQLAQAPPRCTNCNSPYPLTASVPITVLTYNGPLLCCFIMCP